MTDQYVEALWDQVVKQAIASGRSGDMSGVIELFKERVGEKNLPEAQFREVGIIMNNLAILVKGRGDVRAAIAGFDESARYFRIGGDMSLLQAAIGQHVDALMAVGDYQRAIPLAAERAKVCRETGNQEALLNCLAVQGKLLHWAGDAEHAAEVAEQQQEMAREMGGDDAVALSLANRGLLHVAENDLDTAHSLLEQAVEMMRRGTNRMQLANTIGSYAVVLMQKGRLDEALVLQREAAGICREIDDGEGLAKSLVMQALLHSQLGQNDAAAPLAIEADTLARSLGLTAMADDMIKPVLAMCGVSSFAPQAGGSPREAARPASSGMQRVAERLVEEENYERQLAEWNALPWLKRLRTPKPQPPAPF